MKACSWQLGSSVSHSNDCDMRYESCNGATVLELKSAARSQTSNVLTV